MPDLLLENVPQELFDSLQRAAAENRRPVAEEALQWLLRRQLPDEPFVTEETSAPCTLPLPGEGQKVTTFREGGLRLPDPSWIIAEPQ